MYWPCRAPQTKSIVENVLFSVCFELFQSLSLVSHDNWAFGLIFVCDDVSERLDGSYYTQREKCVSGEWTGAILNS